MKLSAISRQRSAFSRSRARCAALGALIVVGGFGLFTQPAEPAGAPGADASRDARAAREVAMMTATAHTFVEAFDALQAQSGLRVVAPDGGADAESVAVAEIREYAAARGVLPEQLAKVLGCRPGLVRTLFEGASIIPPEHRAALIRAAQQWAAADARERELERTATVRTRVTDAIAGLARAVCNTRTIGLVVGGAGLGKTHALQAVAAEMLGRAVVVRVGVEERRVRGFVRAVCRAARGGADAAAAHSIGDGIAALAGSGGLLCIDEAQRLSGWALEAARDLFDAGGVGVLLVGTRGLGAQVDVAADPLVGPLASRVSLQLDLDAAFCSSAGGTAARWIDAATLRAIVRRHVPAELDAEASKLLLVVANEHPGHLRAALNAARVAAYMQPAGQADGEPRRITADGVRLALRMRGETA